MDESNSAARQRVVIRVLMGVLLLSVVLVGGWVYYATFHLPRIRSVAAYQAILDKGVHSIVEPTGETLIIFRNANVTDAELLQFVPAFSAAAPKRGQSRITTLRLNGSPVSKEAVEKFQQAVPTCVIEP